MDYDNIKFSDGEKLSELIQTWYEMIRKVIDESATPDI